ncbi:MAG: hypothetical protein ABI541_02090 [Betaproteobacteria bacterium]
MLNDGFSHLLPPGADGLAAYRTDTGLASVCEFAHGSTANRRWFRLRPCRVSGIGTMPEQAKETGNAKDHARLRALIDKLVAVQLDLKPICRAGGPRVEAHQVRTTLAAACEVLQLAIEDLRDVIHHLDGPPEISTPAPRNAWEQPPND